MTDHTVPTSPDRRLADIVREVKIAVADRTDVVVDMRDAVRARLELLALEIKPVLDEIDPADDRFDFGISPGLQPRLWIDAVAHVHMGNDRRVFRFVRDTRLGRVVMSETPDMAATADAVTRYIAERVIERERILSGDFESMKALAGATEATARQSDAGRDETARSAQDGSVSPPAADAQPQAWDADGAGESMPQQTAVAASTLQAEIPPKKASRGSGFVLGASWFILGCVAGAAVLVVALWDRLTAFIG
ncbi:hypothetical protein [Hoeflea sp.]|uniref:hypothetical protein n=1 Tax=Hoeflea sp. TaxID=1940281 RepID=UPI003A91EBD0